MVLIRGVNIAAREGRGGRGRTIDEGARARVGEDDLTGMTGTDLTICGSIRRERRDEWVTEVGCEEGLLLVDDKVDDSDASKIEGDDN